MTAFHLLIAGNTGEHEAQQVGGSHVSGLLVDRAANVL